MPLEEGGSNTPMGHIAPATIRRKSALLRFAWWTKGTAPLILDDASRMGADGGL
ncbi:hypothetical protein C100_17510 [Sphingobium sp. C100]|nr:hypothetical protein C100_17510 [Sphingobium sp. C100]